jgi:hypothetical protein
MVACPDNRCGREYQQVAIHWDAEPDHRPTFTDEQHEVLKGLVMGDGCVFRNSANPKIEVSMTNQKYLRYLSDIFGVLGTDVRQIRGSTESYSPIYGWSTRTHPEIGRYADWYSSGEKVWPEDVELTSRAFKHWYCGDGHFTSTKNAYAAKIALNKEEGNEQKVRSYFENSQLPCFDAWDERDTDAGYVNCVIRWNHDAARELFKKIGAPLPGFRYKWPDSIHYEWGDL